MLAGVCIPCTFLCYKGLIYMFLLFFTNLKISPTSRMIFPGYVLKSQHNYEIQMERSFDSRLLRKICILDIEYLTPKKLDLSHLIFFI